MRSGRPVGSAARPTLTEAAEVKASSDQPHSGEERREKRVPANRSMPLRFLSASLVQVGVNRCDSRCASTGSLE